MKYCLLLVVALGALPAFAPQFAPTQAQIDAAFARADGHPLQTKPSRRRH